MYSVVFHNWVWCHLILYKILFGIILFLFLLIRVSSYRWSWLISLGILVGFLWELWILLKGSTMISSLWAFWDFYLMLILWVFVCYSQSWDVSELRWIDLFDVKSDPFVVIGSYIYFGILIWLVYYFCHFGMLMMIPKFLISLLSIDMMMIYLKFQS